MVGELDGRNKRDLERERGERAEREDSQAGQGGRVEEGRVLIHGWKVKGVSE